MTQLSIICYSVIHIYFFTFIALMSTESTQADMCNLRPVLHILQQPGCITKSIPTFACQGSCSSYVQVNWSLIKWKFVLNERISHFPIIQVSGSKFWQVERSCMCCQEMGEREASIRISCPTSIPRYQKVMIRAPVECMCRPCTAIDETVIKPQEIALLFADNLKELPILSWAAIYRK